MLSGRVSENKKLKFKEISRLMFCLRLAHSIMGSARIDRAPTSGADEAQGLCVGLTWETSPSYASVRIGKVAKGITIWQLN